ncbi:uncharacterized protein EAF02_004203 [Botrytis sinoallii]|uniref:uncharacterized protein n=1 Tax=Botrytis sinoallii TaxID=1463999 RepID=UPI0019026972|nr:uncharacterized protein EAF02_004203 [Botrytis sinoallii]KAF7885694.1 hypothetical protein EAF02_004203 [Botrytis sinoallii]
MSPLATVGIISIGEMGMGVAKLLIAHNYRVVTNIEAPATARSVASHISDTSPSIRFIDGGIIGGAPKLRNDTTTPNTTASIDPDLEHAWSRPSIPISGPHELSKAPVYSLCIQAFTSAQRLGVLGELEKEMSERVPGLWKSVNGGITGMPPKAYRWVREMEEIGICHGETGFSGGESTDGKGEGGKGIFGEIADVYRTVVDETVLGEEKTEKRKRGKTLEDVAQCMTEGLASKRVKKE